MIWTKEEKDNDSLKKKMSSKHHLLKCIEIQHLHAIFFNSSIILMYCGNPPE
jgi:hypothetical protein